MAINGFRITTAAASSGCTAVAHTTVHILSTIYQTTSFSYRQRIITRKLGMVHLYTNDFFPSLMMGFNKCGVFVCLFVCIQVNVTQLVCVLSKCEHLFSRHISYLSHISFRLCGKWKSFRRRKKRQQQQLCRNSCMRAYFPASLARSHHNHHFKSLTRVVENFTHFSCWCSHSLLLCLVLFLFSFMVDTVRCVITRAPPTTTTKK